MSTGPAPQPPPLDPTDGGDEIRPDDGTGEQPVAAIGLQAWIERNRAKIWIWGIGGLALGGLGCMLLVVLLIVINR